LGIAEATSLRWTAGQTAARHDVYFGDNFEDVNAADTTDAIGIYRGSQDVSGYIFPEALEWGTTYYWRIDEIEADDTMHIGPVWSFTVADYLLIDDFEDYDTGENQIWYAWKDGFGYGKPETPPQGYLNYSEVQMTLSYPRDWTEQGVEVLSLWFRGYPSYVGGFVEAPAGTYTMTASGVDIWDPSDQFHFAYKELSGAGAIIAKIESVANTDDWAKAGVMIRDTLEADSSHAMVAITPGNGVWFGRRETAGNISVSTKEAGITAPQWVKLERTIGGLVRAYYSADGSTWTQLDIASVMMDMPAYIGLALTSHNADATCEAVFSNVSFPDTDIEPQWIDQDVGIIGNEPEPMYVTVANSDVTSATVVHPDPNAALIEDWTQWNIDLKSFSDPGVDLTDVNNISIGFGDKSDPQPGGSGKMYFDDIRLYRPASELQAP
jgi:hypothetical protein